MNNWSGWNSPADVGGGTGTGGSTGGGNTSFNINTPAPTGGGGSGTTAPGSYGATPMNFGQPMDPWTMPYQGQFTAPMSPYEQGALGGYANFLGGGMGLGGASNYLNNELGGQYLNLNSNPYLQQIQQGMQGIKNYNDQQALQQIGSGMALGGNALSGARLGATSDYMRNSNNQFESLMGQLMNQNYGLERGLMNQAPSGLMGLANTLGGGYSQLFGMGALPRSLQQNDLNAQYQDFLRQTGNMENQARYPDQLLMQLLYGGGYRGQYQPMYGSSTLDQIAGNLGGNIDWGSLVNNIGQLFSGGSSDGTPVGYDGQLFGYDGPTPGTSGPANYWDTDWYSKQIADNKARQAQALQAIQHGPNTTVPAILTLLMSMLGGKSRSGSGGMGSGASAGPGGKSTGLVQAIQDLFSKPNYINNASATPATIYDQPVGPGLPGSPGGIPGLTDNSGSSFGSIYDQMPSLPPETIPGTNIVGMDPGMLGQLGGGDYSGGGGGGGDYGD